MIDRGFVVGVIVASAGFWIILRQPLQYIPVGAAMAVWGYWLANR
jgi:multidrug transporter EmrE-like cation transporter